MDLSPPEPLEPPTRFLLAGFTLDLMRRALLDSGGGVVELRPQAYEVLRVLALQDGRLVTKEELLRAVWPDVVVTDDSLVQAIGDARRALGEAGYRVIKTIPRRGYMLVADAPQPPTRNTAADVHAARRDAVDTAGTATAKRHPIALSLAALVLGLGLLALLAWRQSGTAPDDGIAHATRRPSIAVLAFKGPSEQADGGVIARDVAADLVAELARSPDLRVVASHSSFQFDAMQTPLADIGRTLRSRYLVDGSVRRAGEQLRITLELLDSQDGQVVWSASQLADRTTMATIQHELVSRIAGTLQSRVSRSEERRALAQPPKTLEVFVLTAHGKSMMLRYSAEGMREARRYLQQALAIDPQYAPAWAYLGMTDTIDIGLRLTGERDHRHTGEMLAHAQRAVALQSDLTVAYVALSQAQGLVGDLDAALAAAQECFKLSPNDAGCFYVLGATHLRMGQIKAAVINLSEALDRNPLPPVFLPAFYGTALWADGRLDEALRVTNDCLAKAPEFVRCRLDRIAALVELGRGAEARVEAARLLSQRPALSAQHFGTGFADSAAALRERRIAAARQAGLP